MSIQKFNSFKTLTIKRVGKVSDIQKLSPIVSKWEGGYVDDPIDKGGATNMGVTLNTWKLLGYDKNGDHQIDKEDIRLLNASDFGVILKKYWDKWKADEIINQSIANILVDWYWGSGKWGIIKPQTMLGFKNPDGIVGNETIKTLNEAILKNPKKVFDDIYALRVQFLNTIVKNSIEAYTKKLGRVPTEKEIMKNTQKRFINGWLNRLKDFKYSEK